jgi:predicted metal-dependent peptidase
VSQVRKARKQSGVTATAKAPRVNVAEDIKRIRAALCGKAPFITSLLGRARVIVTELVPTAGVDKKTAVYINPEFWRKLNFLGKVWVTGHEILHAAFLHPLREGSRVPNPEKDPSKHEVWNIAADAIDNTTLEELVRNPEMERLFTTADKIAELTGEDKDEIRKMSVEEVFDLLMKNAVKVTVEIDIIPGCVSVGEGEGEGTGEKNGECVLHGPGGAKGKGKIIQEGDPAFDQSPSEIREAWKKHIAKAYMAQKTAGTVPAGLERIVDELIKPSIDPRSLIRRSIRYGLGKLIISDWRRPSRRYPDILPWTRRLRIPTIWTLCDASASIDQDKLKLFLGTVYEFAKHTEIRVVSFDTEAYEFVTARKPAEVISKVAKHIKGGGGTMIKKALEQTLQRMKNKDIVLVLTDLEIFDLGETDVQQLIAAVASKAGACAFCTTYKETPVKGWRVIKLQSRAGG